jgi:aspartate racemase
MFTMRMIGLLGGMSWESSAHYYRIANERVRTKLGGLHSARCLLLSVDFAEIACMQTEGRWDDAAALLCDGARSLERAGAQLLVLCSNTMHKDAERISGAVQIPLVHIADATLAAIEQQGLRRVGLLGTRFTMEESFYRERLAKRGQLEVLIPGLQTRKDVHRIIYEELCLGKVSLDSQRRYERALEELIALGAEGVVLGCTELMLLRGTTQQPIPIFDTTTLHAEAAVDHALSSGPEGQALQHVV